MGREAKGNQGQDDCGAGGLTPWFGGRLFRVNDLLQAINEYLS